MKKVLLYVRILLRKNLCCVRAAVSLLLLAVVTDAFLKPVRAYCCGRGVKVSQWGFPLFWGNRYVGLAFFLIFLYGVCALSEEPDRELYILNRIGRRKWVAGQFLFQILYGWIYTVCLYALHFLFLLPVMCFEKGWGAGWRILTDDTVRAQYHIILEISHFVLSNEDPVLTAGWQFLMLGLTFGFLGALMLWLRFYGPLWGAAAGTFFIFWSISLERFGDRMYRFSPLSWIQKNRIYQTAHPLYPTTAYAVAMLILFTLLFFCMAQREAMRAEL